MAVQWLPFLLRQLRSRQSRAHLLRPHLAAPRARRRRAPAGVAEVDSLFSCAAAAVGGISTAEAPRLTIGAPAGALMSLPGGGGRKSAAGRVGIRAWAGLPLGSRLSGWACARFRFDSGVCLAGAGGAAPWIGDAAVGVLGSSAGSHECM